MKLVDTTFLIDLLRNDPGAVKKAEEFDNGQDVFTTEVNVFELLVGVFYSRANEHTLAQAEQLLLQLEVLPLQRRGAVNAAFIAGRLLRKGSRIDDADSLTAGIAMANQIKTIVTRNVRHFAKVPDITIEKY